MWHHSIDHTIISPIIQSDVKTFKEKYPEFESNSMDYYLSLYLDRKKQKFLVYINSKNRKITFSLGKMEKFLYFCKRLYRKEKNILRGNIRF